MKVRDLPTKVSGNIKVCQR